MPEMLCKLRSTFVKLDFPDPVEYWPEMLVSIVTVGVIFAVGYLGLVMAG